MARAARVAAHEMAGYRRRATLAECGWVQRFGVLLTRTQEEALRLDIKVRIRTIAMAIIPITSARTK